MIKKILQSKKVTILQKLYLIYIHLNSDEEGVHHDYLMNDAKNLNVNLSGLATNRLDLIKKHILLDLGSEPISSVQYATGRSQKRIKINFKELCVTFQNGTYHIQNKGDKNDTNTKSKEHIKKKIC